MYDLTFGQNGHFNQKNQPKESCVKSCPMPLIKLNLLKNHDFL